MRKSFNTLCKGFCIILVLTRLRAFEQVTGIIRNIKNITMHKGGKFLKKLWCCVGGSITR